jgi:molybdate transport system substrate-binding protein
MVLLPSAELDGMAGKLKPGSRKKIGELPFGLAVLAGAPHPDIATAEKFIAVLKGKSVGYNDPAIGSLAGKMVDALLKQPAYAGVKAVPSRPTGGQAVADKKVDMAVAMETEEVTVKGIDIVGPVPDGIDLKLDLSGAVLANAAHPDEAAAFLAYFTGPEAAAILKPTGVIVP